MYCLHAHLWIYSFCRFHSNCSCRHGISRSLFQRTTFHICFDEHSHNRISPTGCIYKIAADVWLEETRAASLRAIYAICTKTDENTLHAHPDKTFSCQSQTLLSAYLNAGEQLRFKQVWFQRMYTAEDRAKLCGFGDRNWIGENRRCAVLQDESNGLLGQIAVNDNNSGFIQQIQLV